MFVSTLEAKEVAWQIQSDQLPTSVTQDFAGANRAANDFINPLSRVMLLKNYRFGWKGDAHPDAANQQVERFGLSTLSR